MFLPFVPGVGGAVASVGLAATLAASLYALRKKIPNPTEFWFIGCWFLWLGIHKHAAFDLLVDVHVIKGVPAKARVYVTLECGRFDAQTSVEHAAPTGGKNAVVEFFQNVLIHVRQCDQICKLTVWRKSHLKDERLGELLMHVDKQIIANDFPKKCIWDTKLKDRKTAEVSMSLYKGAEQGGRTDPVAQQLMINTGEAVDAEALRQLPLAERLPKYAALIEGELKLLSNLNPRDPWRRCYFKATKTINNVWVWCWWPARKAMLARKDPIGAIPVLSIIAVLKGTDVTQRHNFLVRYQTRSSGVKELFLARVDRDRDIWSTCLLEFVQLVREEYNSKPRSDENSEARRRQLLASPQIQNTISIEPESSDSSEEEGATPLLGGQAASSDSIAIDMPDTI